MIGVRILINRSNRKFPNQTFNVRGDQDTLFDLYDQVLVFTTYEYRKINDI